VAFWFQQTAHSLLNGKYIYACTNSNWSAGAPYKKHGALVAGRCVHAFTQLYTEALILGGCWFLRLGFSKQKLGLFPEQHKFPVLRNSYTNRQVQK
jgi:hypothetical protein